LNALLEGETDEGLSMLRDLVHAGLSFKELAEQTGLGEKALHWMLSPRGNPTTRNLFAVTKAICEQHFGRRVHRASATEVRSAPGTSQHAFWRRPREPCARRTALTAFPRDSRHSSFFLHPSSFPPPLLLDRGEGRDVKR
jgi:hypothetical protein